jgi:radical SAM superfamily enzyme YgiQ (UPF0313 family)
MSPKALLLWPPSQPLYDNLCYHFSELGETAGYLDGRTDLRVLDAGVGTRTLNDVARCLLDFMPDVVVLYTNFENLSQVPQAIEIIRMVCEARIIAFGQASLFNPGPFLQSGVDAVASDGDPEAAVAAFIADPQRAAGIRTRHGAAPGVRLPPGEWGFPLIEKLPLEEYRKFAVSIKSPSEKAGISGHRELSVTLSRGCDYGCSFCKAPLTEGRRLRWRDLSRAFPFIDRAMERYGFDLISVYSPNFTANRPYVRDFGAACAARGYAWKCVTAPCLLDEALIEEMARGGCRRIGLGVETLSPAARARAGVCKPVGDVEGIVAACRENGIEPLCFLMLGIPGETKSSFVETVAKLRRAGASVRITSFVPRHRFTGASSWDELLTVNRKLHICSLPEGMSRRELARIIFDQEKWLESISA